MPKETPVTMMFSIAPVTLELWDVLSDLNLLERNMLYRLNIYAIYLTGICLIDIHICATYEISTINHVTRKLYIYFTNYIHIIDIYLNIYIFPIGNIDQTAFI